MGPILLGIFFFLVLFGVMAVFVKSPRLAAPPGRGALPPMDASALRRLVVDLLTRMGMEVQGSPDERRFIARHREPFGDARYVVFVEEIEVVEQPTLLELQEEVKVDGAAGGLLITPFTIIADGMAALDARVELIDGRRLRELIAAHLPERLPELDRFRGFGRAGAAPSPVLQPQPTR